jgi:hypothetical protein
MRRLVITALLLLAAGTPLFAKKDYTDVKLVVVDAEKGTPIPRAAITLKFIRGKKMFIKKDRAEWDVKTDSKGQVQVPGIPAGKMRVLIYAKGYQSFGEDFDISGEEQTLNVKLARPGSQYSAHDTPGEKKPPQ